MNVLVADDDAQLRDLLALVIRTSGHAVTTAANGAEAWAEYEREPRPLVVVDWEMANLDGRELCRRIRAADPARESYVLVVTADGGDRLTAMLDAGADDYVSKPVNAARLRARLAIAERRIAQQAAQRDAEARLARAQWLAGIGETTIALQHQINNPLAALLGHAALIEAGLSEPGPDRDESVAAIVEQAKRIGDVVQRLASLRDPRTVEYLRGRRMIDLSGEWDQEVETGETGTQAGTGGPELGTGNDTPNLESPLPGPGSP